MALTLMQFSVAMMSDRQVTVVTGRSKMDVTCSCASAAAAADAAADIRTGMSDSTAFFTSAGASSRWPSFSTMK